jgi:teichuronic acid exporter
VPGFKKGLFKNLLVSGGFTYLSQGINFLSSVIVSRRLSPRDYGLVGLITVFTGFILVFSDGGLSYALIRSDFGRTYQRVLNNLSWILGFILFSITIALAYPISYFYKSHQILLPTVVLAFTFLFRSLSLVQGAILAKNLDFAYIGKITLLGMVISVIVTIVLAYSGAGFWALVFPQIINAIILTIFYERKVKLGFKIYPLNYLIVCFKHTRKLIASILSFNAVNYWARNSDNLIAGKWYGAAQLGLYARAYTLLQLPLVLISGLFSNILFPSLKKLQQQGGNVESEYYFVLRMISLLTFPLVLVLIAFPGPLVHLLWGHKWMQVTGFLPYFGILIYTQTLLSTVGQLMVLQGKERQFMITGWVSAVFLVSGIVYGSTRSLVGVSQFYTLSYLLLVLIFNVIYAYVKVLKFNAYNVFLFWAPKLLISQLLWVSVYFTMPTLKITSLAVLFFSIVYESRNETGKAIQLFRNKFNNKAPLPNLINSQQHINVQDTIT